MPFSAARRLALRVSVYCVLCAAISGSALFAQQAPLPAHAPVHYIEREMFVPFALAFPRGLDVLEVYADTPGSHPLALLTHGTSNDNQVREHVTPWAQFRQALWFAQRGYAVIVVVRRGYGRSGGEEDGRHGGGCGRGSFWQSGKASAEDLAEVAKWAAKQPEIDAGTIVSVGVSTGGFAQAALSADPPKGLKAAISFAGGRGGDGKEHNCDLGGLVDAFREFGKSAAKHGALPMLWIYAENDHWFPPSMASQFESAYQGAGGSAEFVLAPPDGDDGHHLYGHVEAWSATVDAFLKAHSLRPLGEEVLPPPRAPDTPPPAGLHDRGVEAWQHFLAAAPFKAFAATGKGGWGYAGGAFDQAIADQEAIEHCKKSGIANGEVCEIVARTTLSK